MSNYKNGREVVRNYYISYIKHIIYILLLFISFNLVAQNPIKPQDEFADKEYYLVDSLVLEELSEGDRETLETSLKLFHSAKDDTSRINALSTLLESMTNEEWTKYQQLQYKIIQEILSDNPSEKVKQHLLVSYARALKNLGMIYKNQGQIIKALNYLKRSVKIYKEIGDKTGIAETYNDIAIIYENQGNVKVALKLYHKGLKILESDNNQQGMGYYYLNIGRLNENQQELILALEYYEKSLESLGSIDDKQGLAYVNVCLANVHDKLGDIPKAIDYYDKSLILLEEFNDKRGLASVYNNIGGIQKDEGDTLLAIELYNKSLDMLTALGDKRGMASLYSNIGEIHLEKGQLNLAKTNVEKAFQLSQEIGYPYSIQQASSLLSRIYEKQGKGLKALEMYKLHVQMKDSINNEENQKATIRQQTQYEFEKEQIVKENEAKEQARLLEVATTRRNNLQYSLIFLGILLLFVVILMLGFIKVSPNVAEGLIFFAFLILFEFILVFTDPYLQDVTHDEPMYNLAANAIIALLIFPLHAVLEKLLKKRIVK